MLEHGKSRPGMEILRSTSSYLRIRILVIFLVDVAVALVDACVHVTFRLLEKTRHKGVCKCKRRSHSLA